MDAAIEVSHVSKVFRLYNKPVDRLKEALNPTKKKYHNEFYALNDVSFQIQKGEAVGIVGKNGSGKSTLLKLLTRVQTPTCGAINVNGKVSALLELGAGFNGEYTGEENIYLNGEIMGYTRKQMAGRAEEIIKFADIGDFIYQPVKTYSSGMFVRLAFAAAINVEPDILIIDEALSVGDIRFQMKCIDKMKELKEKGITILFVSHATEQVKRFCSRCIWINEGEILASGNCNRIIDQYEVFMKDHITFMEPSSEIEEKQTATKEDNDIAASITRVAINKNYFKTFDCLNIEIDYEIYDKNIENLLLGVAFYTPDREYIFGPNTSLDRLDIPKQFGRHTIIYSVDMLPMLIGVYDVDVGLFTNGGLVCINYKTAVKQFTVLNNDYIGEGKFYIEHKWKIIE